MRQPVSKFRFVPGRGLLRHVQPGRVRGGVLGGGAEDLPGSRGHLALPLEVGLHDDEGRGPSGQQGGPGAQARGVHLR